MTQTIEAVYSDGVLKPLEELALADHSRVRLTVEPINGAEQDRSAAMQALLKRLNESLFSHGGPYPTREERMQRAKNALPEMAPSDQEREVALQGLFAEVDRMDLNLGVRIPLGTSCMDAVDTNVLCARQARN